MNKKELEKTIIMRHNRAIWVKKGDKTRKQLENYFIEEQLKKGYVPSQIEFQEYKANAMSKITGLPFYDYSKIGKGYEVLVITSWCGYAGKKQARKIWEENKKMLNEEIKEIKKV